MLEALAILVALAIPLAFILLIVFSFKHGSRLTLLGSRLAGLEAELATLRRNFAAFAAAAPAKRGKAKIPAPAPEPAASAEPEAGLAAAVPARAPLPWQVPRAAAAATADPSVAESRHAAVPGQVVFTDDFFKRTSDWVVGHWVYVIAAISLALAGVFMVQYGIDNGLLTPRMRVLAALALGAALIGGGEYMRRKGGDGADDFFAYIPSTLAAGGLVSLFGGVFSAHALYNLIGAGPAFFGLALVGAIAIGIGWFYGPLLAAIGILGSTIAPFMIGGSSESAFFLNYYFAAIAVVGLTVDTLRHWGWLSAFAMVLAFIGATVTWLGVGSELHYMAFAMIVALAAVVIPDRKLIPDLQGSMIAEAVLRQFGKAEQLPWPNFPVRLAALGFGGAVLASLLIHSATPGTYWLSVAAQIVLLALAMFWLRTSRALEDFAALPVLAFLLGVAIETGVPGSEFAAWQSGWIDVRPPEMAAPRTATILLGLGSIIALAAAWRSLQRTDFRLIWAGAAALIAPVVAITLELLWAPKEVLGNWNWALHLIVVAAIMTFLAERSAARDGEDRRRFALFALSALSMISFALFMILTKGALTVALAVMVVAAAWMDRKWNLRVMGWFIQLGGVVAAYRLTIDPGLFWGFDAPLWEVSLSFLGVIGLFYAALRLLDHHRREGAVVVLESAVWSFAGIFASLMLARFIDYLGAPYSESAHAFAGLFALIWLISWANQLYRLQAQAGWLHHARTGLALIFGIGGLALVGASLTLGNPVSGYGGSAFGPYLLDSLFLGYLLPAAPLVIVATQMPHLPNWLRLGSSSVAAVLAAAYTIFEIRRFWRGNDLSVPGTSQPELYTYTVAMLLLAAGLLALAYARRSPLIRKLALAAVALAVAKVFLIDMAGLSGLIRVASFLVLGLVLAGLAWVNRWFVAMEARATPKAE